MPTLQEARRLFGAADDDPARQRRSRVFYQGIEARQRMPQGMHDRGEEYVVADGRIHERDRAGLANHLPVHVKVIRLRERRLSAGEVWDVSVRHTQWPQLDYLEELYVYLDVDRLVLEPGARVVVHGNVLFCRIGTLERAGGWNGPVSPEGYDFGILPTPFSVDLPVSRNKGMPGRPGLAGHDGADGRETELVGSFFGPLLAAPEADPDGRDATDGEGGTHGQRGQNGGMCKMADLRIGRLVGFEDAPLRVFSQAGAGGPGGDGGDGGPGGRGGRGRDGAACLNGTLRPGRGGNGGSGGSAGDGGNGGNGGVSSNIFLQLAPGDQRLVETLSLPSQGGPGGRGGAGGQAGEGGSAGGMRDGEGCGAPGREGRPGADGRPGARGKDRPGAGIFLV